MKWNRKHMPESAQMVAKCLAHARLKYNQDYEFGIIATLKTLKPKFRDKGLALLGARDFWFNYPVETLVETTRHSERSVYRSIAWLVKEGVIEKTKVKYMNYYRFLCPLTEVIKFTKLKNKQFTEADAINKELREASQTEFPSKKLAGSGGR